MNTFFRSGFLIICLGGYLVVPYAAAAEAPGKAAITAQKADAPSKKTAAGAKKTPAKPKAPAKKPVKRVATKSKSRKGADVIATDLPKAKLDLSLPKDMVRELDPPGQVITAPAKPLLPAMFGDSPSSSDFQLNGRLLSNEMQLQQRRNDTREVEGAALDFEFKQ